MTSPAELPEGTVTVLFTDVVGSTELTNRVGDDAARGAMRTVEDLVRVQLGEHRGYEVKGTGDGLMLAFQSARRAVTCAIEIQRALAQHPEAKKLGLSIGLSTGEVVHEVEDLFGATVNLAARVAAQAAGGEILISDSVRAVLGSAPGIELEDRGEVKLKGFDEAVRLHEVVWRELEATGVLAANDPTPLVGRGDELATLRGQLERARDGTGSLVMVSGEPGAGKTRLCREVAAEAEALGFAVRFGHCYDSEGAQPYAPLVEMFERAMAERGPDQFVEMLGDEAPEIAKVVPELRRRFPDLPPALTLPKEQERHFFLNSIRAVLTRASEATPQLMVFEDLHWADEATLAYIDNLAPWVGEARLLVIGTYRDVELDVSRPLAATLRELLRRRQAQRIDLPPLGEDGVREMLLERSGQTPPPEFVARVFRETQGNPFFLEEVFQHLFEQGALLDDAGRWRAAADIGEHEVPESIRLVIGERLERVSPECHALLTEGAVMGRGFSYPLIEELTSLDPTALLDALDEAEAAHLIRDHTSGRDARYEFVHDQIRQTLLTKVSVPRRQRLHLKIADAIEAIGLAGAERALPVAHHLYEAGAFVDPQRTTAALLEACAEALRTGGYEEVVSLANQALEIRQFEGARQEAAVLRLRARAFQSVNQVNEAVTDFEGALQLLAEAGDTETFAEGCLELAELAIYADAPASRLVLRLVGQGIAMADERVLVRAKLATAATLVCAHAGESPDQARARAEEARVRTEACGDAWLAARAGVAQLAAIEPTLRVAASAGDSRRPDRALTRHGRYLESRVRADGQAIEPDALGGFSPRRGRG